MFWVSFQHHRKYVSPRITVIDNSVQVQILANLPSWKFCVVGVTERAVELYMLDDNISAPQRLKLKSACLEVLEHTASAIYNKVFSRQVLLRNLVCKLIKLQAIDA